jgi:hypothetical protein
MEVVGVSDGVWLLRTISETLKNTVRYLGMEDLGLAEETELSDTEELSESS